jgi:hypothetical protein
MIIQKQKLTLLSAFKREGTKKEGGAYMFYTGNFLDSESNVLKMNLSNELSNNSTLTAKLVTAKQVPCVVDLSIYQSGFNLKGTVVKIEL